MSCLRFTLLTVVLLAVPIVSVAQLDDVGNYTNEGPGPQPGEIGLQPQVCGDCKDPDAFTWGVTFRNGEMWVVTLRRKLYRMDGCEPVEEIPLTGTVLTTGLGYDRLRDVFIVADASFNVVFQVRPSGRILAVWPTPGPGPIGAAYDPGRDLYWLSDWEEGRVYSIDPKTGLPGPDITIPAGSRISGLAYDANLDALVYHSRDEALTYWISVETHEVLGVYNIPFAGKNNGAGAGLDTDGALWISHNDDPRLFCEQELGGRTERRARRERPGQRFQALTASPAQGGAVPTLDSVTPNPFNPNTEIRFTLPQAARVFVAIYDARGAHVQTLVDALQPAGSRRVRWDAGNAPSGVYFCRMKVGEFSQTRKMVLLR